MTGTARLQVSFHKYGDFFPGTGSLEDNGHEQGLGYSLNVPLQEGMDDDSYALVFKPVISALMAKFQPEALVVCAGADSLSGDRLGCFNLSLQGHSACLEMMARFNVPMLVLGGGGYTMRNVSRCWMYETARLQGVDPADEYAPCLPLLCSLSWRRGAACPLVHHACRLPDSFLDRNNYYMDTRKLRIHTSNMMNLNTRDSLVTIRDDCLRKIAALKPPSGAAISEQPAAGKLPDAPEADPDVRGGGAELDELRVVKDGYDSDEEAAGGRVAERPPPVAESEVGGGDRADKMDIDGAEGGAAAGSEEGVGDAPTQAAVVASGDGDCGTGPASATVLPADEALEAGTAPNPVEAVPAAE